MSIAKDFGSIEYGIQCDSDGDSGNGKGGGTPSTNSEDGGGSSGASNVNPRTCGEDGGGSNGASNVNPSTCGEGVLIECLGYSNRKGLASYLDPESSNNWEDLGYKFLNSEQVLAIRCSTLGDGNAANKFLGSLPHRKPDLTWEEFTKVCDGCECRIVKSEIQNVDAGAFIRSLSKEVMDKIVTWIGDTAGGDPAWPSIAEELGYSFKDITTLQNIVGRRGSPTIKLLNALTAQFPDMTILSLAETLEGMTRNDAARFLKTCEAGLRE